VTLKTLRIDSNRYSIFSFSFFWAFNWCYSISKYGRICQTN